MKHETQHKTLVEIDGYYVGIAWPKNGSPIPLKMIHWGTLFLGLPGILVHELGHLLGIAANKKFSLFGNRFVFWSGPLLPLVLLSVLSLSIIFRLPLGITSGLVGTLLVSLYGWIIVSCLLSGTVWGLRDWKIGNR